MRVVIVAGEYEPLQGGLGDFSRELGKAMLALGHDVHVVTRAVEGAPAAQSTPGQLRVHRVVPAWNWSARRRLEAFVRDIRPDVVNLQYQAAAYQMHPAINLLAGQLRRRVPMVVTFHDLRVPYFFPKAGPLRWRAVTKLARDADAVIVTNAEDERTLRAEKVARVSVAHIGSNISPVDLPNFDAAKWKREHAIPPDVALFGYFGFMNDSKGGDSLIAALAQLRADPDRAGASVGLLHIGGKTGASDPTNAAYARKLEAMAGALGVREFVYETGFLDDRGVSEAFAACKCVALPYRDGVSFRRGTLMAALAHGAAIVTTAPRVSLPELRAEDNVLLVSPDDPTALADAIARVLRDTALRQRLREGSRALSALFGWDRIAADTLQVFASVLCPSQNARAADANSLTPT